MKMRKYIAMAAVAMTLAACTNDDTPGVPAVDKLTDTPIMVNAGVGDLVTRAGMTTDDLVDLGLHITNEANDKYSFANIEFEKNADGEFVLAGSTIPLWQNETQKIIVQAYSPYNAAWTDIDAAYKDFEVKTDQSTEANLKASDLLWAGADVDPAATTQTGDIKYNAGALDITLNHICSKIIVNVRFGNEFSDMIIAEDGLSIEGLNPYGRIKLASGSIGYSGYTTAEITAYKNQTATTGYDETFEAILIPQNASFSVKIALDGRTFQWENDDSFSFQSGKAYTLNLNVGKDEITLAGVTVGGWNEGETLVGGEAGEIVIYDLAMQTEDMAITSDCVIDGSSLTTAYTKQITITGDVEVTLKNVNQIASGDNKDAITINGDVILNIEGENTINVSTNYTDAIRVNSGSLTINGTDADTLLIDGHQNCCGAIVLANGADLIINGGYIDVKSGAWQAGIGAGYGDTDYPEDNTSCGDITINGGIVTATGGYFGAGIGAARKVGCGKIAINGGTITATGDGGSAGIGSGHYSSCGDIIITGGTITAKGGTGIGSGYWGTCGNITISGTSTSITAVGDGEVSIGAEYQGTCGTVTIGAGVTVNGTTYDEETVGEVENNS